MNDKMIRQACNEFVLVIRDPTETEKGGLIVPNQGRVKPHSGTVHAVGNLVRDREIKQAKGKKVLFHPTVGWEIDYEGQVYLVLQDREIIALP